METQLVNLSCGGEDNAQTNGPSKPTEPLDIEYVEKVLNYKFKNKSLLVQAFTDASFDESYDSNDRLEYFGDSVLNMVVTKHIYFQYPNISSGLLTNLRAVNVDTEKLARVAVKHNLYRCLRHKKPVLEDQVLKFTKEIEEFPLHSRGLLEVPKSLADIVESTIGAIYVDSDSIETVWKVVEPLLDPIITLDKLMDHPKTQLNEMCQKRNLKLRFEDTWEENKTILVFIDDNHLVGRGHHLLKKNIAFNCAAKNALDNFSYFFKEL